MKTLFDIPLSRQTDPGTSRLAAKELAASGIYGRQKRMVYEGLKRNNGTTSAELAQRIGVDRYVTARRLPDLEREGIVRKGPARLCEITNSLCVTWWIE
jgi:predicted transcriptional regulator